MFGLLLLFPLSMQFLFEEENDQPVYIKPKKQKNFGCWCGKAFSSEKALDKHKSEEQHFYSKKAYKVKSNYYEQNDD